MLRFYSQKFRHFTIRDFHEFFFNWHLHIYKKHDTLSHVTFLHTKSQKIRKKRDNLRYVFYIQEA